MRGGIARALLEPPLSRHLLVFSLRVSELSLYPSQTSEKSASHRRPRSAGPVNQGAEPLPGVEALRRNIRSVVAIFHSTGLLPRSRRGTPHSEYLSPRRPQPNFQLSLMRLARRFWVQIRQHSKDPAFDPIAAHRSSRLDDIRRRTVDPMVFESRTRLPRSRSEPARKIPKNEYWRACSRPTSSQLTALSVCHGGPR